MTVLPGLAWADTATALAWLQAQVQSTGQLASVSGVASEAQSICAVASTLLEISGPGAAPAALTAALDAIPQAGMATEVLACTQWLQQQQSQIPRSAELLARRSATHGFAAHEGHGGGSILDTAWALQALAGTWSSAQAEPTLVWLQQRQMPDGSFTMGTGSDLLGTARVLRSLQAYRPHSGAAAAVADKAASYLLAQSHAAGHWQSDIGVTALVYEAVHPYSGAHANLASAVRGWLLAGQAADGAWGDDPWTTAVALRALVLAGRVPVHPAQTALQIQFVDARTATPMAGVQVTGNGAGHINGHSDAAGRLQLQGLTPGAYTLTAAAPGYSSAQIAVSLHRGQITDLGVVQMLVPTNAVSAVINGTVRDSASGDPIAGVDISVAGSVLTASTDGAGRYLISDVPPGAITVRASKAGYFEASVQTRALAGQTLNFSPGLVRDAAGGAGGTGACRIMGTITRAADNTPLAGVSVTLSGANSASASTDASGAYTLTGLVSGEIRIIASLAGHDSAVANTRLHCNPQGNTALQYSPRLYAGTQSPPQANTAGLRGIVLDARTNQPIAAAQLTFTTDTHIVRSIQSQADGRFSVSGLDGATAQLELTATGYQGITVGYVSHPGRLHRL